MNKAKPCPICQHTNWCMVAADQSAALCARIEQGAATRTKGGWVHRLTELSTRLSNGKDKPQAGKAWTDAQAAIEAAGRQCGGSFAASWTYHNRDGSEFAMVIRYDTPNDKEYRPIHRAKDGYRIGDPSGLWPLYRLNDLPADGLLYICEGEKAVEAARKIGLAATTSAHGASAAEKSDWTPLAGRQVCLLPDHDEHGRKYAQDVARLLVKLDPPAQVKIVELPGLSEKGDLVEYIAARAGQAPATIRAEVEALTNQSPEMTPGDLIGGPLLVCLADVEPRKIRWLWPERVALGRITLLVGMPGEGKSFLTIDMAARVTRGEPWPDGSDCPTGSVIIISAEDDPADTIRPRLDAHGADVRKVHLLSAVRHIDAEGKRHDVLFTLADVAALELALKAHPDCRLIVVDPIGSFLGRGTDAHRDNEVRGVLAPVGMLAEKYGPAVLVVAHRRKSTGSIADDLALGSRAFTGIARAVWHLSRDKDNKTRRLLLSGKNNLALQGNGMAFTIYGEPPVIAWERDPVAMSADDALELEAEKGRPGPEPEARAQAAEWLQGELADLQGHPVKTLKAEAKAAGLAWRTVQRATANLKVKAYRAAFGGDYVWRLPQPTGKPSSVLVPMHAKSVGNGELGTHGAHGDFPIKIGDSTGQSHLARQVVPNSPSEEPHGAVSNAPFQQEEEKGLSLRLIKEMFPDAEIIGPDDTNWESHARRIKTLEAPRKPGCRNCRGLRFWTWPEGYPRCARCYPPAEPDKVIWLGEEPERHG